MTLAIFLIIFQYFFLSLVDKVADYDLQYNLYMLFYMSVAFGVSLGWFRSIDYKKLLAKSVVLFQVLFLATEIISWGLSFYGVSGYFAIVRALGLTAWFYYILYRKFSRPKIELNNKDIFAVRTVPDDFQGLVLSLINPYPLAGYGLMYKNNFYHFHHGKMVKSDVRLLKAKKDKFIILKSREYDPKIIKEIDNLVGSKWSLTNNCWTRIRPLLK